MPEKTANFVLVTAVAVAVGSLGYLAGFRSTPAVATSGVGTPHPQMAEQPSGGEAVTSTTRVEDAVVLANGVGAIAGEGEIGTDSARRAFLEASEKRGGGGAAPRVDETGSDHLEEDNQTSDTDIVELSKRMEAIEQAFALDNRRNRGRDGRGGGESQDIEELKETVSNLYDIVGGLPSLDTLETKVAAVDGAIEEMNATMEKLMELGGRLESLEKGEGGESEKTKQAVAEIKSELAKITEGTSEAEEELSVAKGELAQNTKIAREAEAAISALRIEVGKGAEEAKASREGIAGLARQVESLQKSQAEAREAAEVERRRIDALVSQVGIMDKNLRSAVEGYRKVYENSAKTEKRFLEIEAFLGNIEARMGAVEANFGPAQ